MLQEAKQPEGPSTTQPSDSFYSPPSFPQTHTLQVLTVLLWTEHHRESQDDMKREHVDLDALNSGQHQRENV